MELVSFSIGDGGWVRLELDGRTEKPFVLVRFADQAGRLRVRELYLEGKITEGVLRYLSGVSAIEDIVNEVDPTIADSIRSHLILPGADLCRAAGHYSTSFGDNPGTGRGAHWISEMFLQQFPKALRPGVPDAPDPVDLGSRSRVRPIDAFLDAPMTRPYPDAFFERVADVYRRLTKSKLAPAVAIAAANSVPRTTAHRWIREARRRKVLEPAQAQGRAG